MKIQHNNQTYVLDINKALSTGSLKPIHFVKNSELEPGDVFIPTGSCPNPFVLYKVTYGDAFSSPKTEPMYQLIAFGANCNSGPFFTRTHTMEEIEAYLVENKMIYSHNVNSRLLGIMNP